MRKIRIFIVKHTYIFTLTLSNNIFIFKADYGIWFFANLSYTIELWIFNRLVREKTCKHTKFIAFLWLCKGKKKKFNLSL